VDAALAENVGTPDIGGTSTTTEVGEWIAAQIA
jgi:isocitrate/isopropylmalate dehydrogenase